MFQGKKIQMRKGKKVGERVEKAEVMKDFVCWGKKLETNGFRLMF